jgi:hypothetical protein
VNSRLLAVVTVLGAALSLNASAQTIYTVNIDSMQNGSNIAGGPQNLLPGTIESPINAVQLTLGAGTFQITNAASSGYYSAWNFQGSGLGSASNWVWSFEMAVHGGAIVEDAYVGPVMTSQTAMASLTGTTSWNGNTQLSATSTAGFDDTFTLSSTTILDFYIDDNGLSDNYGGVSLNIQAVPEPSTCAALTGLGVLGFAAWRMRRRRAV